MEVHAINTAGKLPLVSIAMCTYNGEKYLQQQLDSLLGQTYHHTEIMIVDDASSDRTKYILEEYAARDSRIKFLINERNIGYNRNFEKAIGLCSAQYVAISDQDDVWEKNKIEVMMQQWPAGCSFVYSLSGNFRDNDIENRTPAPDVVYTDIAEVYKLVFSSPVNGHACMFKKELMQICTPFPPDIFYDWWMSMHAAATGKIGCVPYTLTWHRHHDKNSSRDIMSIKEMEQRNEQLRKQSIYFIESFCNGRILEGAQRDFLLQYTSLLKGIDGKRFSWPMFRFVFNNRKKIFHYKKPKPFILFSYLKHAMKMAYKGLL